MGIGTTRDLPPLPCTTTDHPPRSSTMSRWWSCAISARRNPRVAANLRISTVRGAAPRCAASSAHVGMGLGVACPGAAAGRRAAGDTANLPSATAHPKNPRIDAYTDRRVSGCHCCAAAHTTNCRYSTAAGGVGSIALANRPR